MGRLKNFEIVFDDNRTVFYPGQLVSGKCLVDLKADMKMRSLRITMRGIAKVHWTESRSTGNRLGAYTEHYNAEIEYFVKRQILFGSENGVSEDVLHRGYHEFRFSFALPSGGISTSFEGKYGSVRYWLKAEMDKPWSINPKVKKAFTVISPININRHEYLMPVENQAEKTLCCWFCLSGPISLHARTDRRGYCPGESIAITADFENLSSRLIIPRATLHQTQTFVAGGKSRSRRNKFTIVTGVAIQPGRAASWDSQLLKIPAVSPSIINCALIKVEYSVRITLQIPGAYNLSVDLPVIIGTVAYRTQVGYSGLSDFDILREPLNLLTPAPPYREHEILPPPLEPPPSYVECMEGSVDIGENEEGLVGDTHYTPLYAYVLDYQYRPPPAYSEVDPNPTLNSLLPLLASNSSHGANALPSSSEPVHIGSIAV